MIVTPLSSSYWLRLAPEFIFQVLNNCSLIAQSVYLCLLAHAPNENLQDKKSPWLKGIYPSLNTICKETGLCKTSVCKAIKQLENDGLIRVIRKNWKVNHYEVIRPYKPVKNDVRKHNCPFRVHELETKVNKESYPLPDYQETGQDFSAQKKKEKITQIGEPSIKDFSPESDSLENMQTESGPLSNEINLFEKELSEIQNESDSVETTAPPENSDSNSGSISEVERINHQKQTIVYQVKDTKTQEQLLKEEV